MATSELPPPQTITIPLSAAKRSLESPQALRALVNCFGQLSEKSIEDLGPLVFDVLHLGDPFPVAKLLTDMLKHRPEWLGLVNEQSFNLLSEAVTLNRLDLVDVLMDAGADTTHETTAGFGVLDVAAQARADHQEEQAYGDALLGRGTFSIAQKDRALNGAAYNGNLGMTRSLLAHGAGFTETLGLGTTLADACALIESKSPAVDIVRALLQTNGGRALIDEGWGNPNAQPPINHAAFNGNLGVIAVLLEAGARVNPPDNLQPGNVETPLMSAAHGLQPEAIHLLLKSGCDPKAIDALGRNALHYLADYCTWQESTIEHPLMLKAIRLLTDAGTDPHQVDTEGWTPLNIAMQRNVDGVIEAFTTLAAQTSSQCLTTTTIHPEAQYPSPPPRRM